MRLDSAAVETSVHNTVFHLDYKVIVKVWDGLSDDVFPLSCHVESDGSDINVFSVRLPNGKFDPDLKDQLEDLGSLTISEELAAILDMLATQLRGK